MPKKKRSKRRQSTRPRASSHAAAPQAGSGQVAMFVRVAEGDERRVEIPGYQKGGVRCPEVLLHGPEVTEYADLFSMRMDFEHVITMCEHRAALAKDKNISQRCPPARFCPVTQSKREVALTRRHNVSILQTPL